jgi:hypothetical protein
MHEVFIIPSHTISAITEEFNEEKRVMKTPVPQYKDNWGIFHQIKYSMSIINLMFKL